MALKWALAVVVSLATCATLSLSLPQEVTAREIDTPEALGSGQDVSLGEELSRDARMAENALGETANTVNNPVEEADGVTDEQFPVSIQEGMDFGTLQKILNVIMYIIDSYFESASLGDWLATLGMAERDESQEVARFKFSPPVVALVEALRPLGFTPYPDPYVPLAIVKKDLLKFSINTLGFFGILALFWREYLPIPYYVYEKLGFPQFFPGYPDPHELDYQGDGMDEEMQQDEENQTENPYGAEEEKQNEENQTEDPYEGTKGQEDVQDPNGQEEGIEEDNYYKVGEEEKEREHESFAVFKQKEKDEMTSEGYETMDYQYKNSLSENHTQEMDQDTQSSYSQYYYTYPQYAYGSYYTPYESAWDAYYQAQGEKDWLQGPLRHSTDTNRRIIKKRPGHRRILSRRPGSHRFPSSSSSSSSFPFSLFS
ncbi:uncharacterized protein LOC135114811 [Scylla paramamosain]|uniref:uncharacterized protein LOC135114811 n=1 Tax=Scylla paramamosain TaxID=85552 RepID=UPI00308319D0